MSSKSALWFLELRFLKCLYHIWAWQPSWSCDQHYVNNFLIKFNLYLQAHIQDFVENGPVVSEKNKFNLHENDLGLRSSNDLDLQKSHIFINSISFRSKAAIVYEKSTVFTFSIRKAYFTKFDLVVK